MWTLHNDEVWVSCKRSCHSVQVDMFGPFTPDGEGRELARDDSEAEATGTSRERVGRRPLEGDDASTGVPKNSDLPF